MDLTYEYIATGRRSSLFADDIAGRNNELTEKIRGSRIAIVVAAGSIGSAVVKTLLRFDPAGLCLIDLSENNLVALVRDLRSTPGLRLPNDFNTLPIGMGSIEFSRYFDDQKPYDYFFNLAAMKHVRSEKDIYCLIRMLDTNVLFLHEFLGKLRYKFKKVFSVSSDKAANPANLMGASKMIMEQALLYRADAQPFSTARFANVAFSDGSLPHGFLERIARRQPIAAPNDITRYFISHQEAGELCVLSCMTGENRDVFFPKMNPLKDQKTFAQIATGLLCELGYEPFHCDSEEEARTCADELIGQKKWPCVFGPSTTDGEKSFEEFFSSSETLDIESFPHIGVIKRNGSEYDRTTFEDFIRFLRAAKTDQDSTKTNYVRQMTRVVPALKHIVTGKNLDQKM